MKSKINFRKLLKRLAITIISILALLILLILSLRLPAVQNYIKDKLVVYLENKINTKVSLDRAYVGFPNSLIIENLYLKGQDVDTLLAVKKLDVGLDMWQLINSKADITAIDLAGVTANVVRKPDGTFNFDYIMNAFATSDKEESPSKPFIISLDKIKLKDIGITFNDQQSKNDINIYLKSFDTRVKTFDLQNNSYAVGDINLDGLKLKLKQDLLQEVSKKVEQKVDSLNQSKPMKLSLKGINLSNFDIDYGDENTQLFAKVLFKKLNTKIKNIDLENNAYAVNNINVDGLKLKLTQDILQEISKKTEPKAATAPDQSKAMKLDLNHINLTDFDIDYGDKNSKTFAKVVFKELNTKLKKIDLENNYYDIRNVLLSNANINANLFIPASDAKVQPSNNAKNQTTEQAMTLLLGKLILDDVKVNYNNSAMAPTKSGMDFNHLNFNKLNLDLRDFKMENNGFAGNVKSAEIREARGLDVQKFKTNFVYGEKEAYLKNLYLKTPKTILRDEVILTYNSIQQLSSNPGAVKISANIRKSEIGFSDILNLAPTLRSTAPFNKYPNAVLNVNANVRGTVNDLLINELKVSGLDQLKVEASGRIKNAMNPDQLQYDLKIDEFSGAGKTIFNLVPKNTIPSNISLPSQFKIKGTAKGTTQIVNTDLNLSSSLGNASVIANLDMRKKNNEKYDIKAKLQNLQVGQFIQNKDIGPITAQITAKGESFDLKKANAKINGNVESAHFKNYNYQNINLIGSINHGVYDIILNSQDPNAKLNLAASGIYNEKNPTVKVNGHIANLDLKKIGFYESPMIIKGIIDGDFTNLDPDNLNGYLNLKDFAISDTKEILPIREASLKAISTEKSNVIQFNSQIADIELNGQYKLTQIFGALQQTINQYYQFQKPEKAAKIEAGQYFSFNTKLKNDDLIRKFVPDLKSFETIDITGNYDADSQKILVNAQIPNLLYGANTLEDTSFKITNDHQALQYNLNLAALKNESFAINKVNINGDIAHNIINYNVTTKDDKDVTQFLIAGNVKSLNDITEISLNPNGLKLNYMDWAVAENNKIQIGSKGIIADNFRLSNAGSEILLQSESNVAGTPLNVTIRDFKIGDIAEIIKKDSLLVQGTINGTARLKNLTEEMSFTSDINISDLIVFGSPVGNLDVKVNNASPNIMNANIALSGNNNDVKITGDYNTSTSTFDLKLALNQLQMKTLQGFSMNAITNTEGFLSGNLNITGTATNPKIIGDVKMNNVGLMIAQTGSDFRNINDKIDFTNRGIEFNNFSINDKAGNSLKVDGQILTTTYKDFAFNLNVNAKDFNVINSKKSNDAIMYGILAIDAALRIRGNLDLPKVDGRLAVSENTDFTFVLPQSNPSLQERDGIVEFIDQDQVALNKTIVADSLNSQSNFKGMDVSVNIEVDKEAKMSIVIDKVNGDLVKLQGEAELTGGIDPSGKVTLVGVYEVEKGSYDMTVSILKRQFEIQKGSTITWTGEPTAAILDITAIYKTQTAPLDLVEQQISGGGASLLNQFKQRIEFNTLLQMKGELLKPNITFDITTDEKNNSVSSNVREIVNQKLTQLRTQENEMNKQVFALLLLNRFIGENPFQSSAGLSTEAMARQSVSKLLSEQLNNLASDLIKGVDLNLGLASSEDYTSGAKNTRTDLNLDISKRLLNDRLKVTIGSNFGLEGDARKNENMTNIAGDVTLDYSLSKDGRYMLRAYRKNEYQVALQGQIVETGVGFIITLDYDKFREIFQKAKKEKASKKRSNNEVVDFK